MMDFVTVFKRKLQKRITPTPEEMPMNNASLIHSKSVENPYVIGALGRKEWDDRYFNMARANKQLQIALYAMLGLVVIFAFLMVREANKVKVTPFVVEMNDTVPIAIKEMSAGAPNDKRIILFALEQFIVNARSILSDETAERALLEKVYAYASDRGVTFLNDYYQENDPFERAATHTTSIDIVNVLQVSDKTYQITWDETGRDSHSGRVISKSRYIGDVTYKMGEVDKRFIKDNPFGLYVSDMSWSQNKV